MVKRKRAGGRPPQGDIEGKSAVFSTRITPETRAGLEGAAKANGRSLSQEIEKRLIESLESPAQHEQPNLLALAYIMGEITPFIGDEWRSDPWQFQAFRAALDAVLGHLCPPGDGKPTQQAKDIFAALRGDSGEEIDASAFGRTVGELLWAKIRSVEPAPMSSPLHDGAWDLNFPKVRKHWNIQFDEGPKKRGEEALAGIVNSAKAISEMAELLTASRKALRDGASVDERENVEAYLRERETKLAELIRGAERKFSELADHFQKEAEVPLNAKTVVSTMLRKQREAKK